MLAATTTTTRDEPQPHTEPMGRDDLIHAHIDMARRLARKIGRRLPPTARGDELESAAYLGLAEAAARFDSSRGEPFVAYAAKRIRGAVLDELRRADALTRRGREHARRIDDATREAEKRNGGPAAEGDVAGELGLTPDQVSRTRGQIQNAAPKSLDDIGEALIPDEGDSPAEICARAEEKEALAAALADLPERERLVLSLYYREDLTLKEIGEILGITESRVSQIRSRTLRALRGTVGPGAAA